jgi:hypothetical protein
MPSATDIRRRAVADLAVLAAGPGHRYDLALVASRPDSLQMLRRFALDRGHRDAVADLWPLVIGDTAALIDATQETP